MAISEGETTGQKFRRSLTPEQNKALEKAFIRTYELVSSIISKGGSYGITAERTEVKKFDRSLAATVREIVATDAASGFPRMDKRMLDDAVIWMLRAPSGGAYVVIEGGLQKNDYYKWGNVWGVNTVPGDPSPVIGKRVMP